ncbi:hypothetical protein JKG68_25620 [Microvirga aerilata]|uniref:Mobilization protein n=1 Tax=Microvirga aerilata TaxID=670292 RepID=A0A937CYS5_9HYPH|nr:hypothetical protein [Microvirga aerilata]MBL0407308.1 hypothetical protein [Microvirga aerilata]
MKNEKRSYGEGRECVVAFRMQPDEYVKLKHDADDAGMTVSSYAREVVMKRSTTPMLEKNILFSIRHVLAELKKALHQGADGPEVHKAALLVQEVFTQRLLRK